MEPFNPFTVTAYLGPEYFCDRQKETARILDAMQNGRNMTLLSLRRMGKTGLVRHAFHVMEQKKIARTIYMDIMPTNDISELTAMLASNVFSKLESSFEKTVKSVGKYLSSVAPSFRIDPVTGNASLDLKLKDTKESMESLDSIFKYLQEQKGKIVIAFDEFQQVANYEQKNTEAFLRSKIQHLKNVSFIFSGSQKHVLTQMFGSSKRPFYQSTEFLELERIDAKKYSAFIRKQFKSSDMTVTEEAVKEIFDLTRRHTFYVQYLCNRLYSAKVKIINGEAVRAEFFNILKENESQYYNYRNLLPDSHWQVLRAIAKNDGIDKPYSVSFARTYNLSSAGMMQNAIPKLLQKEMIVEENGILMVYDVYFSSWLKHMLP